jgi:undecaprenyl-diphosphatase
MDIFQTIILGLIQGLTEFLPISSSAHLVLIPKLSGMKDQGLAYDVVLHFGTLCAIVYYYRCSLLSMSKSFFNSLQTRRLEGDAGLAWAVLLGTIPVGLAGIIFKNDISINLRSVEVIAFATIFFGLLLGFSDWLHSRMDRVRDVIRASDVLIVGCFQALALIPGTSRSGITITAALLVGLSRQMSIKFSFLLAIPVITLATLAKMFDLVNESVEVDWLMLTLGFIVSTITAYATVVFFIRLVDRIGFLPFVIYRILLGVLLLLL